MGYLCCPSVCSHLFWRNHQPSTLIFNKDPCGAGGGRRREEEASHQQQPPKEEEGEEEGGGTRGREASGLPCPGVVFILGIMHYGTVATTEKKENHQKRLVTRRVVGGVTKELPTANELTVV